MCLFHLFLCFSVIKGELAANGCISFWTLYSALLFYANGMMLGFLKMCFVVRQDVPSFAFTDQDCFDYLEYFVFTYKFLDCSSTSEENSIANL